MSTKDVENQIINNKFLVFIFLFMGVINTLAFKLQGSQEVHEGQFVNKRFYHPYIQTFTMFLGESMCLIGYLQNKSVSQKSAHPGNDYNWKIFIIPAISDGMSSLLQYMGLFFTSGSVYMIFKGSSIITTAIFSKILLKMIIQMRHIIGCSMAILGLVLVGAGGMLNTHWAQAANNSNQQSNHKNSELIGYALLLASLIFNGFLYAYQQKLLRQHSIHPLEMFGWEGIIGMMFLASIIFIFSLIPCNISSQGCVFDSEGNGYLQLPSAYIKQIFANPLLFLFVITAILTMAVYNGAGVTITKLFGGLTRSLLNVTRTGFLWIAGIMITLYSTNQRYHLQSLNIWVTLLKLLGFSSIIIGTLIYNKIIYADKFPDITLSEVSTQQNCYQQLVQIKTNNHEMKQRITQVRH